MTCSSVLVPFVVITYQKVGPVITKSGVEVKQDEVERSPIQSERTHTHPHAKGKRKKPCPICAYRLYVQVVC